MVSKVVSKPGAGCIINSCRESERGSRSACLAAVAMEDNEDLEQDYTITINTNKQN